MADLVGQVLQGRYRIEQLIGRGGMAEVYKAYDTRRQYPVAIKVMREDLAEDVEFIHRFRREAQALAALSHANIVRFYSFGRQGRLAFIVMDLVQGSTLRGIILDAEGAPLPLDQAAAFTHQIAAALHYAHGENILHRDIKPGNIMVQPTGQVLVADFGIAKAADAATATTVMPGTPAYMSPEQCLSQLLDPRTDVYALGIVVYEMLAGRRPFRGDSSESGSGSTRERIRWEQIYLTPPPLRSFNPALPAQVDAVVLKALEKDRRDRWPSVLAFAQAFEHALRQAGVTIVPRVPLRRTPQPAGPAPTGRPRVAAPQPARSTPRRAPAGAVAAPPRSAPATRTGPLGIPTLWLVVTAGLVVVVLVGLALLWPRDPRVPDLVNWDLENAIRIVEQAGYRAVYPDAGDVAHSELLVAAQNPVAGERLAEGSSVYLDLEAGMPSRTPTEPGPTATPSTPGTPTLTPTGTSSPTALLTPVTVTPSPTIPDITLPPWTLTPTPTPTPSATWTSTPTPSATPTSTDTPAPVKPSSGDVKKRGRDGMNMAYVPAGEFSMGSNRGGRESPVHTVYLDAYWLDKTEVTNDLYRKCVQDGTCSAPTSCVVGAPTYQDGSKGNHPVVCVSWNQASKYCSWAGGRLPTEAEWEKGARGTDGRSFPWGNGFDGGRLNFCDQNCDSGHKDPGANDGYRLTAPRGTYAAGASPYGAKDMAGNVWEWTADWNADNYYSRSPYESPKGADSGSGKVMRGGSFDAPANETWVTFRNAIEPSFTGNDVGFRCIVPAP